MRKYKYQCGCETQKIKETIYFKKICKRHKQNGACWIALQHDYSLELLHKQNNEKNYIQKIKGRFN